MVLALLADGDADTRQMYGSYLRQLTYEIDEAEDGREALAKAISRGPTVIVTETRLPGIGGVELCELLRRDTLTKSIPIIVVTADALPNTAKRAEAAGADAVLVKPCLPDRLAAEILRVLAPPPARPVRTVRQRSASGESLERPPAGVHRVPLTRSHARGETRHPPTPPPALYCPACDGPLRYVQSHIGGVSERNPEQWDYFECPACRGTFEYRHRTRKVRTSPPGMLPLLRWGT
jgi:CheY-like chemotaxis protein